MAKARILAVDDQLYFRVFLEDLLAQEGFEVLTADSGQSALHLLEREHVDVVLTDLVMPTMSGVDLVDRVKEHWPEQEILVVTSVSDVRTAVDAMRRGATDYLLKPVDRTLLVKAIDGVLQRRRLRNEHARLIAENLEYLGVLSLYERAMGLFATLAIEPLAERIVEGLCLETGAQGGVLWLLRSHDEDDRLRLAAARGLVRLEQEVEDLSLRALPPSLARLQEPGGAAFVMNEADELDPDATPSMLVAPLHHGGRLLGFARLTDKLAGPGFDERDRAVAERFAEPAALAVRNALRHRALERRSFRDATTKAYTWAYFEDVVRYEIQKAGRFGRSFSLIELELEGMAELRSQLAEAECGAWLEAIAFQVGRILRATDLLAAESDGRYVLFLPETDALGAVVLKRRIRELLERGEALQPSGLDRSATLRIATVSFPVDGSQLETLERVLAARLEEERSSLAQRLALQGRRLPDVLDQLVRKGEKRSVEAVEQIFRFVVGEVERRSTERGVVCLAPGAARMASVVEGLSRLESSSTRTEVVLVSETRPDSLAGSPVTFVSPQRAHTARPFVIYYAEGPAYALVTDPRPRSGSVRMFHSADRLLVEQLAFQLQRDLGIPIGR